MASYIRDSKAQVHIKANSKVTLAHTFNVIAEHKDQYHGTEYASS